MPDVPRQLQHDVAVPRHLQHDVAVPQRVSRRRRNLGHSSTEASSRPVTPNRPNVGLEVSLIDGVTLSDGEGRENAHTAADMVGCSTVRMTAPARPELGDLSARGASPCAALRDRGGARRPAR